MGKSKEKIKNDSYQIFLSFWNKGLPGQDGQRGQPGLKGVKGAVINIGNKPAAETGDVGKYSSFE